MTPPMLRQLRHDVWATARLIENCRSLSESQLGFTMPGTYGPIRRILAHVIAADERYLLTLTLLDVPGRSGLVGLPKGAVHDDRDYPLYELASHARAVAQHVEQLFAGREFEPDIAMRDERRRAEIEPWVLVTQFAHHGSDHRAQICSTLGANGLAVPDLDVWAYAREIGGFRPFA